MHHILRIMERGLDPTTLTPNVVGEGEGRYKVRYLSELLHQAETPSSKEKNGKCVINYTLIPAKMHPEVFSSLQLYMHQTFVANWCFSILHR